MYRKNGANSHKTLKGPGEERLKSQRFTSFQVKYRRMFISLVIYIYVNVSMHIVFMEIDTGFPFMVVT